MAKRLSNDHERDRKQVSLMHVFRSAAEAGDARKTDATLVDGDRQVSRRSKERREGTDEHTLKRHLSGEIAGLMNTINLEAAVDLDGAPHVRDSVLNYGFGDMSHLDAVGSRTADVVRMIRDTLLRNEPRLIAETIEIKVSTADKEVSRRMTFEISAEMHATPVDVPLEFVAEVDAGAGKVQMTRIKVAT